jgi:hypothetical protein
MYKNLCNLISPSTPIQTHSLAVIATFLDEGYLPDPPMLTTNEADGSVSIQVIPTELCAFIRGTHEQVQLRLRRGEDQMVTLALRTGAPGSDRLSVEVTMNDDRVLRELRISDSSEKNIQASRDLTQAILRSHPSLEPCVYLAEEQQPPYSSIYPPVPPRQGEPWGGEPLRYLPGHTPEGGDQVGPHHPMFGDPRYDPLGPGGIGEPDYDHQVPAPFGQSPQPRGPPRFPPPGGVAPGPRRFGGPRML